MGKSDGFALVGLSVLLLSFGGEEGIAVGKVDFVVDGAIDG